LYGLLLDVFEVEWRQNFWWRTDMAQILRNALGFHVFTPFDELDLTRFNYAQIRAQEEAWVVEIERRTAEIRELFSYPTLRFCWDSDLIFEDRDDLNVLYVPGVGAAFFGVFVYAGSFGRVYVDGGYSLTGSLRYFRELATIGMAITPTGATGPGWELVLNPGYQIHPGEGYYVVRR